MKKALLAYNPMSGNRFVAKHLDSIIESFQNLGVVLSVYRIPKNDQILSTQITDEYEFIIGAGGDGTLSQIVQIMLEKKLKLPFFALGSGTCNNFTRNIDVSKNLNSEVQSQKIIEEVFNGKLYRTDVGLVDKKSIFLTSLAGGAFSDTSFSTDKSLKLIFGPLAYYLKPLTELSQIKAYPIKVTVDGKNYEEKIYMFLLLNGKSVGNFNNFIDSANLSDGIMELILIKESSPMELANLFLSVSRSEDIEKHDNVLILKGKNFSIDVNSEMKISMDGEQGPQPPFDIEVKQGALEVFVSKDYVEQE